jgi:hypothetical protein
MCRHTVISLIVMHEHDRVKQPDQMMRTSMTKTLTLGLLALMTSVSGSALAKTPPPMPIRGTIDSLTGSTLQITEMSGAKVTLTLAPGVTVTDVIPATLADVKPGTYVGTAAIKQPSGVYRAMELQIFPDSMRGVGLGTRDWNLKPHSTMTNGTVGGLSQAGGTVGTVSGSGDMTLTVNDGSGSKTVLVPSSVPVVTYTPGTAAQLLPGAHVMFFPMAASDGTLTAKKINVGKDGLVPPM